ncbi:MAG TPA: hypothetical protein VFS11_10100 [Gemmatimonadales bacterium]|nr:hypothetical protein [Gemmatimonadales bacterium]
MPAPALADLRADALEWARDKYWHWRLPLLAWLGLVAWRHLKDPDYSSIFSGVIFGSHEFGHLFFAAFGQFMAIAGGSLMQLLVPLGAAAAFLYYRDYFGIAAAGCWLSMSLSNLAVYIGDAVAQELPLVSFSPDGGEHDWYWLLDRCHCLGYDLRIAAQVRHGSAAVLIASMVLGAWLCYRMARPHARPAIATPTTRPPRQAG